MLVEEAPITRTPEPRRFTTEEFHRMVEAGVFGEDERVELIDGNIMLMLPIGDPHIACVRRLAYLFSQRLYMQSDPPAYMDVQSAVRLSEEDDPQPDVVLLHPEVQAEGRAPKADEVFLLVEVASSSLAYDRGPKLRRYALHGIPEVWVVAIERACVYVYRDPAGAEYRTLHTHERGEVLAVAALPDLDPIPVDDVLGPASD